MIIVSPDFEGMKFTERLDIVNRIAWKLRLRPHVEVIPLTPEELREKLRASAVIRDAPSTGIKLK